MIYRLIEDKNNKPQKHLRKNAWWLEHGVEVLRYRLPVGDYVLVNNKVEDVLSRKKARDIEPKMMDFVGTYDIVCDSKKDIQELIGDIKSKDHARFRDSLIFAQNNGIKVYIVVEDDGGWCDKRQTIYNNPVRSIDDLFSWENPRLFLWRNGKQLYPSATKGAEMARTCNTYEDKYGCKFVFCSHNDSAEVILKILLGEYDG